MSYSNFGYPYNLRDVNAQPQNIPSEPNQYHPELERTTPVRSKRWLESGYGNAQTGNQRASQRKNEGFYNYEQGANPTENQAWFDDRGQPLRPNPKFGAPPSYEGKRPQYSNYDSYNQNYTGYEFPGHNQPNSQTNRNKNENYPQTSGYYNQGEETGHQSQYMSQLEQNRNNSKGYQQSYAQGEPGYFENSKNPQFQQKRPKKNNYVEFEGATPEDTAERQYYPLYTEYSPDAPLMNINYQQINKKTPQSNQRHSYQPDQPQTQYKQERQPQQQYQDHHYGDGRQYTQNWTGDYGAYLKTDPKYGDYQTGYNRAENDVYNSFGNYDEFNNYTQKNTNFNQNAKTPNPNKSNIPNIFKPSPASLITGPNQKSGYLANIKKTKKSLGKFNLFGPPKLYDINLETKADWKAGLNIAKKAKSPPGEEENTPATKEIVLEHLDLFQGDGTDKNSKKSEEEIKRLSSKEENSAEQIELPAAKPKIEQIKKLAVEEESNMKKKENNDETQKIQTEIDKIQPPQFKPQSKEKSPEQKNEIPIEKKIISKENISKPQQKPEIKTKPKETKPKVSKNSNPKKNQEGKAPLPQKKLKKSSRLVNKKKQVQKKQIDRKIYIESESSEEESSSEEILITKEHIKPIAIFESQKIKNSGLDLKINSKPNKTKKKKTSTKKKKEKKFNPKKPAQKKIQGPNKTMKMKKRLEKEKENKIWLETFSQFTESIENEVKSHFGVFSETNSIDSLQISDPGAIPTGRVAAALKRKLEKKKLLKHVTKFNPQAELRKMRDLEIIRRNQYLKKQGQGKKKSMFEKHGLIFRNNQNYDNEAKEYYYYQDHSYYNQGQGYYNQEQGYNNQQQGYNNQYDYQQGENYQKDWDYNYYGDYNNNNYRDYNKDGYDYREYGQQQGYNTPQEQNQPNQPENYNKNQNSQNLKEKKEEEKINDQKIAGGPVSPPIAGQYPQNQRYYNYQGEYGPGQSSGANQWQQGEFQPPTEIPAENKGEVILTGQNVVPQKISNVNLEQEQELNQELSKEQNLNEDEQKKAEEEQKKMDSHPSELSILERCLHKIETGKFQRELKEKTKEEKISIFKLLRPHLLQLCCDNYGKYVIRLFLRFSKLFLIRYRTD